MTAPGAALAVQAQAVDKRFRRDTGEVVQALESISVSVTVGGLAALVGPDGAGKTTLMRLLAGLMRADAGTISLFGVDVVKDPQSVQSRLSYMPQQFGLYDDLTVRENLDLYADLHGVTGAARSSQYGRLMDMTGLARFQARLAGQLSGGMKQKLGLACALVRSPELLLLDEPTVGVDPLSRRELWDIIHQLIKDGMTVLISTSFLDEAAACDQVLVLNEGKRIAEGPPDDIAQLAHGRTYLMAPPTGLKVRDFQAQLLNDFAVIDAVPEGGQVRLVSRTKPADGNALHVAGGSARPTPARFEDGFVVLLHQAAGAAKASTEAIVQDESRITGKGSDIVVEVKDLCRSFGKFQAVDQVSFTVRRGEIFGLLGPNGAGKTTTFRMLCGLLPATAGRLTIAGTDVRRNSAEARQHLGYVAQKFSLYGQLTLAENLAFFARAYGLSGNDKQDRIDWAVSQFTLEPFLHLPSGQLPGGFKQRLAMAAALLHRPEILFLDEPTSGADPFARREFWRRITALSALNVTIIVTTHFMPEAEYCDRAAILDGGKILAQGTPAELRDHAPMRDDRDVTIEDAFIAIVEKARAEQEQNGRPAALAGRGAG